MLIPYRYQGSRSKVASRFFTKLAAKVISVSGLCAGSWNPTLSSAYCHAARARAANLQ